MVTAVKKEQKSLYEATVLLAPTLNEKGLEKVVEQIEDSIKNFGGDIVNAEQPSHKKLTFKIKGHKDSFLYSVLFKSKPDLPNAIRRSLAINDDILRSMIVKKEIENESK